MKRTLMLAAAVVALTAGPALAQAYGETGRPLTSDAGKPWSTPHRSTASGLPTESPQVESLYQGNTDYSGGLASTRTGMENRPIEDTTTSRQGGRVTTQSGRSGDATVYGRTGTTDNRMRSGAVGSGSTGYTTAPNDLGLGRADAVTPEDIRGRRGPGQVPLELRQTTLLNEFSARGYTAVRDFRRNGERYIANVQDQQGRWMTVELDPRTGTITPVR